MEYPRCGTCQKAKKWLNENGVEYEDRHIVEVQPTREELVEWVKLSGLPLKKFFNTSGKLYKDLDLKNKLATMSEDEQLDLLASNGMMVKRPIVVKDEKVLVGFKESEWSEALK